MNDLCAYCWDPEYPGRIQLSVKRGKERLSWVLCDRCYQIFSARMKETAVEVGRTQSTCVASRWKLVLATPLLVVLRWLVTPPS